MFLALMVLCSMNYKFEFVLEENTPRYNFKIELPLAIISLAGRGKGRKLELSVRVFFIVKKIPENFIEHWHQKSNDKRPRHNALSNIKKFFTYRKSIEKILYIVKPKYVKIKGVYGLGNPYITGILGGIFAIIESIVPQSSVNIRPDFCNKVCNMNVEIKGDLKIISLIFIIFKNFIMGNAERETRRVHRVKSRRFEKTGEVKAG